jgi:hypothetical protein
MESGGTERRIFTSADGATYRVVCTPTLRSTSGGFRRMLELHFETLMGESVRTVAVNAAGLRDIPASDLECYLRGEGVQRSN